MGFLGELALIAVAVFLINVAPGFMPPTWIVLVAFRLHWDLPVIPLVLVGAVFATIGRIALTWVTAKVGRFVAKGTVRENLDALARSISQRPKWAFGSVFAYTLAPLPSNQIFIAAGLSKVDINPIVSAFFITRLMTYGFTLVTTSQLSEGIETVLSVQVGSPSRVLIELLSLLPALLIGLVPWKRLTGSQNESGPSPSKP